MPTKAPLILDAMVTSAIPKNAIKKRDKRKTPTKIAAKAIRPENAPTAPMAAVLLLPELAITMSTKLEISSKK